MHLCEVSKIVKFIESKSGMVVARSSEEEEIGIAVNKCNVSVKQGECEIFCTTLYLETTILCIAHLKFC